MHTDVTTIDLIAVCMLLAAALHDIAARTVSNGIIATLLTCGAIAAMADGRLVLSTLLAVLVFTAAIILWARGAIGGADAKLLGACALLTSPSAVPAMLLQTALTGGILTLPYLAGPWLFTTRVPSQRPSHTLARILRCERWRLRRRGPLPYAVAIAIGTILSVLQGP